MRLAVLFGEAADRLESKLVSRGVDARGVRTLEEAVQQALCLTLPERTRFPLRSGVPALARGARGVSGPRAQGGWVHPCARLAAVKVTMLLADFAQVADGKLTVVGGGWSLTGPELVPFGIALLIQVPWDRAEPRHVMRLELLDADGEPILVETDEDGEQPVVFFDDLRSR